jgi:FtsP/CotA-like multicopper oxidase with cupredoxin domain
MTYRFRFINGHFDSYYNNISFAIFYQTINGSISEVLPPMYGANFTQNMFLLNFTAIGTDGALFSLPLFNLNTFHLAGGERLEALVKFDAIPVNVSKVYVVCYDGADSQKKFVVKLVYNISSLKVANKYPDPTQYSSLPVPFSNLTQVSSSNISLIRMRALFSRPLEEVFSINMHPHFNQAASENPKIGSIEDWYIINTISESHPIHFHIINFQVMEELSLKTIPEGCTLYELDYFRESNISQFQIQNNSALCLYLDSLTPDMMTSLWPSFNSYLLEN